MEKLKGKYKIKRKGDDPYEYFNKYKMLMKEIHSNKEEDYKIIINGKVYDKRDIYNVSKEVLKICNVRREKLVFGAK
jgi:SepF-like predicted cell division protein (DUF552 family)